MFTYLNSCNMSIYMIYSYTPLYIYRLSKDLQYYGTCFRKHHCLNETSHENKSLGVNTKNKLGKRKYKCGNGSKKQDLSPREATLLLGNNGRGCGKDPHVKNLSQEPLRCLCTRQGLPFHKWNSDLKPKCLREA